MPTRHLPPRPNLRQVRHQAKDLLRAFHRGDQSYVSQPVVRLLAERGGHE